MNINELYDVVEKSENKNVIAVVNGNEIPLSAQYYVEDGVCYLFKAGINHYGDIDKEVNGSGIKWCIECEAEDECWNQGGRFRGRNSYGDCEIRFVDGFDINNSDDIDYEITNIEETEDKIILICN